MNYAMAEDLGNYLLHAQIMLWPILLDTGEMKLPYDWAVRQSPILNIRCYILQAQFIYVLYVA